jgi:hypothetical protein
MERYYRDLAQLLIVLVGADPAIWRRVEVSFFTQARRTPSRHSRSNGLERSDVAPSP